MNANKNGYPNYLFGRAFKSKINRLIQMKSYGPEKCPILLILPYAGEKLTQIEKNIKKLMKKVYWL